MNNSNLKPKILAGKADITNVNITLLSSCKHGMVSQDFFAEYQDKLAIEEGEDLVSLFTYIAHLPVETITDVEPISKLLFELLGQLYGLDFNRKFVDALHNLKKHGTVLLPPYKIYIRDSFIFKILLFTSFKYKKSLFIQTTESTCFLQHVLLEIVDTICITKQPTIHLLKLLEMILKKREDVLIPELSVLILKSMVNVAYSPLTGFKHSAQNVSRIVLRSLPRDTKNHLCNFNNLPIKGIDLNDILKLCEEEDIRVFFTHINKLILKLFCNNTESRDASFYYEAITNICTFEEFVEKIWPFYSQHLQEFDEGEFYQSFLKYWIPITVKCYKDEFYMFVADKDVDFYLKAYTLFETKKKGYYKPEFNSDTFKFLKYEKTSVVALRIVAMYNKKHIFPNKFDLDMVKFFIETYGEFVFSDYVLKNLRQFISQIFVVCHLNLSKSDNLDVEIYSIFLEFVYRYCMFRIADAESCEVSAQLLKIVWDVAAGSSAELLTSYKIDRENVYDVGSNLYFQKLTTTGFWDNTFLSPPLIKQINSFFKQDLKFCPNLVELVIERYLETINLVGIMTLTELLDNVSQSVCLESSEKIRSYTHLLVSYKKLKKECFRKEILSLSNIFKSKIDTFDAQNMFTCVLIFDIFVTVARRDTLDVISLTEESLAYFGKIFDNSLSCDLNVKEIKVLESFINNVIEYVIISKTQWKQYESKKLLNHLCTIIQKSNLKRPVSLSINLVHHFGSFMEASDKDREIKIKLLDRTLNSLYHNKQSGKIRRNPETRLVIHALCLTDKNLTKPFLISSLNFMLEVLANPLSSDSTLSSTLHSLEVLVSDNSIHHFTLPFVVEIIEHCVRLFNRTNWIVRNANLQLLKSLIERLLGVSLDENKRPKTVQDLFILFPTLIPFFFQILTKPSLDDSAVIVLLFFSESQLKNKTFLIESLEKNFDDFRRLFVDIIKNFSNNLGLLAIKAFVSLCPDAEIPHAFFEIVYYIQQHFVQMRKNVFANLIKLLQELYQKYESSLVQERCELITCAINNLVGYLKPLDSFYFNLLSLKLFAVDEATRTLVTYLSTDIDYQKRIWLNNYIPQVIGDVSFESLGPLLTNILSHEIHDFLQIKILQVLVDRSGNHGFPVDKITHILVLKLSKLVDSNRFLISAYAKSILLFYEITKDFNSPCDLIAEIRRDFQTDCIYKVFIYILALAHCNCLTDVDQEFVNSCVWKYIDAIGNDDELLVDLAATVKHLYKTVSIYYRYDVIKLVFYLLLNDNTYFETCKFVSWLTKSHCSSVLVSLVTLLNCTNLTMFVGCKRLAVKLLSEFYCYIDDLSDEVEESDTYYLIENDCPLPKEYVKVIILKSLEDCYDKVS